MTDITSRPPQSPRFRRDHPQFHAFSPLKRSAIPLALNRTAQVAFCDSSTLSPNFPTWRDVPIGLLSRLFLGILEVVILHMEGGEWVFAYSQDFRAQSKVAPIIDFPHVDREYRSHQPVYYSATHQDL
jgi:hypothetical protein